MIFSLRYIETPGNLIHLLLATVQHGLTSITLCFHRTSPGQIPADVIVLGVAGQGDLGLLLLEVVPLVSDLSKIWKMGEILYSNCDILREIRFSCHHNPLLN